MATDSSQNQNNSVNANFAPFTKITQIPKFKFVFLGDPGVGKTSIISRFLRDTFERHYQSTIGIDFQSKTLDVDGKSCRLQLWDTAGQERFQSLIPGYIRDSSVAVIVYDITQSTSFFNTSSWIQNVRNEREDHALIVLVGNKTDLRDHRQVSTKEAEEKAQKFFSVFPLY